MVFTVFENTSYQAATKLRPNFEQTSTKLRVEVSSKFRRNCESKPKSHDRSDVIFSERFLANGWLPDDFFSEFD